MKDFAKKSITDLEILLSQKREDVQAFRFGVAGSNKRNVKEGNSTKKDIARILTILNKKESK